MKRITSLNHKRDALIQKLTTYSEAITGNLSKGAVPPGSTNSYWRITWKEQQKTKILYVRPDEVATFRKGIKQYGQLKKTIQQIGDMNRTIILLQRSKQE